LASNTDPMYIGYNTGWGEYWNGRIDELRISSANRSYEWIATEYANQYSPGTFFKTIGTQGESSCSVTPTPTPPGGFPWYDCDWGYRKNITIDYTKVSGAQTNFPVLVSLSSDTGLSGHAQGDGDDILFTASDGTTKLSHEIESYTSSTGALTAWVKIPSLSATSNTVIMMYYGNSGASSQQVRNGVWDSSYKGVWHLNETVTEESTSGTHYDSTSNGNDGTQHNNGPITGKVGGAQYFDGTSDYITVLSDPSLDITSSFTMEAWVYLADATNNQKIVGNLDLSHGYLLGVPNAGGIYPEVYDSTHTMHDFESGSFSSSTWTHLVMNWTTNGRFSGFINGNPVYSEAAGSSSIGVSSGPLRMGVAPWDTGAFPVTGRIDEVRISSTSRSPGWIKTEYDNMNSPSTFSSVDNQVSSPCSVTPTPTPSVTWYDCSWQERKKVTIDHTKVYGTQGNFSVLVSLSSDSDLAAHAQSDFDDILFTASDGTTKLSHDIESYTSGTGALTSWVRVPSLSSSTDTVLYLYYGNPSAGDQRDKTNAWDPDYKGVWHLSNLLDSTNNVNDVSSSGSASATGKMANARSFDGNDYLTRADTSTLDMTAGQDFTVSAWVRSTQGATFNNWPVIMRKVNDDVSPQSRGYGLFLHNSDTDNRWFFEIQYQSGPPYPDVYGVSDIADDTWHYIVGVREGSTIYAYEDDHTRSSASGNSGDLSNNNPMRMGSNCVTPNPNNLWYTGRLDELRVSKVARSAGWIATEYANQNSPSTFSSLSGVESAPCTPVPTTPPTPTAIPTPSPPWYNCYWTYRKNITINKAYVSGTQTDFPALISLSSDSGLRDHARTDGGDIFFTTSNGQTIIPHERESYTPSTGALTAWVKVPQIQSTANTSIFMYYGYPASPDMSSPTNVWDQYYRAVWHLNEDFPNEVYSGKVHNESTSNANNALQRNNSRITGKIAGGQYFDGNMDYLDVPTTTNLNITKNLTLETWMYTSSATDQKLIYKYSPIPSRNGGYGLGVGGNVGNPGRIYWEIYGANAVRYSEETVGPSIATGSWTHVAVTWGKGERIRSYVNGALVNTPVVNGNTDINASLIVPAPRLGAPSWTGIPANAFHLNGGLDEVRISSINRSTSWILTEWRNQDSPSTFTAVGPQEGYSCGGTGPTYIQSRSLSFGSASQGSITLPSATTAGNLLVLSLVMDSQALSVSSVTDTKNGAVYNLALAPTNVGTWGKLYTYYVNNSLGGSGAITATVTLSGTTPALLDVFFLEYSGVAAVSPLDQTSAGSGTGTVMNSGAKDITNATELIYGFGADDYECHATAPYTDRETANGQCAVDWSVSLSGTYNVTATQSSSGAWALQMATFKGA
ncbi:MAG: DUF2341 domain-containing protein, partial [Methanomicrobiales archaeon]|nr:DUF2341 domain-containing protein [Methanomicrobiales archaeon]